MLSPSCSTFRWLATISVGDQTVVLGSYRAEREAAIAYDRAAMSFEHPRRSLNLPRTSVPLGRATPKELRAEARRRFKETTTSRFTGVFFNKQTGRWVAKIEVNRRQYRLGSFELEERAAEAYDEAAVRQRGAGASVNFAD